MLAGAAGSVLLSSDNGASFRTLPTESNSVYSDVLVTPDNRLLLVGFGGISILTAERGDD